MNTIFADLVTAGKVAVYLDDILIFTNDLEEHCHITREVLKCLQEHDLYLRPEKCEFEKTDHLGLQTPVHCPNDEGTLSTARNRACYVDLLPSADQWTDGANQQRSR
jgi:hypothetical protein